MHHSGQLPFSWVLYCSKIEAIQKWASFSSEAFAPYSSLLCDMQQKSLNTLYFQIPFLKPRRQYVASPTIMGSFHDSTSASRDKEPITHAPNADCSPLEWINTVSHAIPTTFPSQPFRRHGQALPTTFVPRYQPKQTMLTFHSSHFKHFFLSIAPLQTMLVQLRCLHFQEHSAVGDAGLRNDMAQVPQSVGNVSKCNMQRDTRRQYSAFIGIHIAWKRRLKHAFW